MTVLRSNEIELNGKFYKIVGPVRPRLASRFPGKVVMGDYSKDSEVLASSWIISDQRGGILVEEMDEAIHLDRSWWSTCDARFKNQIVLPAPATATTALSGGISSNLTITNRDCETAASGWTGGTGRSSAQKYENDHSWELSSSSATQTATTWTSDLQGKKVYFAGMLWSDTASATRLKIYDGVGTSYSSYHTGGSGWEYFEVSRTLDASATQLTVGAEDSATTSYMDFLHLSVPVLGTNPVVKLIEFNDNLYLAVGTMLFKLDTSTGNSFTYIRCFPSVITDLVSSHGDKLYILLGGSDWYWYMNTSEVAVPATQFGFISGVHWSNQPYFMTSSTISTSTDADVQNPTWTTNGTLPLDARPAQNLFTYRDASGVETIYAATNNGLYIHDATNSKWLATELTLPDHPAGGQGAIRWRDAAYVSAGQTVYKYVAGSTATIQMVGLDKDDGLPSEYNAEIVGFIRGHDEFYALLDSTQTTGTSTSFVAAYNGSAWRVLWTDSSTEQNLKTGLVSTVYAYRLWFVSDDNSIYYIPLYRGNQNPKKISGHPYDDDKVHITPWFDADTSWYKTAIRLKVQAEDMSANETVVVKYRIDYSDTSVDSGWTTLGTVNSDGETSLSFGSSAGISFKTIQFRFDLGRGTTNTNSPSLKWVTLVYTKNLPAAYGWGITLDLTESYRGRSIITMWDDLEAIINSNTLVPYTFASDRSGEETHYVRISALSGEQLSGERKEGIYNIELVAP